MQERLNCCILFVLVYVLSETSATTTWGSWSSCRRVKDSPDQNCVGYKTRRNTYEQTDGTKTHWEETGECTLTNAKIDGGYTQWTEWEDCSDSCSGTTWRTRLCNDPTPCNGGEDCTNLGRDAIEKDCGPVDGGWTEWGDWSECVKDGTDIYGNGEYVHSRYCTDPEPICGGDECFGEGNETAICRVTPSCLSSEMFSSKFLRPETPMAIYTSAQVDIYLLTKNKCSVTTIIQRYWELYKVEYTSNGTVETQIGVRSWNVKFSFNPGENEIGLYRMYAKVGYPGRSMTHWMEESMYVQIVHPPPHAFIKGGAGRTVGEGIVEFDARSVSYSLTNGPGDPSGLLFNWTCLNFLTGAIYNLFKFNLDANRAFNDSMEITKKWYETNFVPYIENLNAFIDGSALNELIDKLRSSDTQCKKPNEIMIKVEPNVYRMPRIKKPKRRRKKDDDEGEGESEGDEEPGLAGNKTTAFMPNETTTFMTTETTVFMTTEPTTIGTTTVPFINASFVMIPLTWFYSVDYMSDFTNNNPKLLQPDTDYVLPYPGNNSLVRNELEEFMTYLFTSPESLAFPEDIADFSERIQESSLTLNSLYALNGLPGLPESANETFFDDLRLWLETANVSQIVAKELLPVLDSFTSAKKYIDTGLEVLANLIGIEELFKLTIDKSGTCLMNYLGDLFEAFSTVNSYNWHPMKKQEIYYLDWIDEQLFQSSACEEFEGFDNGTASLNISNQDVVMGTGYLVYIRVEFSESVSYFIQHAQAVPGSPSELTLECRLNCMKKTALTSTLSLKATCPSCTFEQQKGIRYWWNVLNFDILNRGTTNNTEWRSWMLSDVDSSSFVMKPNVLEPNNGYVVEVFMQLANGETSHSIWLVTTNILPYGGTCDIQNALWGEKKVMTYNWKDEGFRTTIDESIDWKEQLNYRIVQVSGGMETLLYYGTEEENYIKLKPGVAAENFTVIVKVQVFDIFVDYAECIQDMGEIKPSYSVTDAAAVNSHLTSSSENVDYYTETGNFKQVAMNVEVAGSSVNDLTVPSTIFDTDPGEWISMGSSNNETNTPSQGFDELWDMYENPDLGDSASRNNIIQTVTNFAAKMGNVTDIVAGTSTVNIDQIAIGLGTVVNNKEFSGNGPASSAFRGNSRLLDKMMVLADNETYPKYEDYIETCTGLLRVLNNALDAILPKTSVDTPAKLDFYSVMDEIKKRGEFEKDSDADLTSHERAFIASNIAKKKDIDITVQNKNVPSEVAILLASIKKLGHILKMLNHRKQMPVKTGYGHIKSTEDKKLIGELLQKGFKDDGVELDFVESGFESTEEQAVQVTSFKNTPFSWNSESKYITSETITVSVGSNSSAAIPSKIKIKNPEQTTPAQSIQLAIPTDVNETTTQTILYKIYWKTPSDTLIINVKNAVKELKHTVYMRKDAVPTEDTYDFKRDVEDEEWTGSDEIKLFFEKGLYTSPVNVYVAIMVGAENPVINTQNRRRRAATTLVNYEISGASAGCRVWDDANDRWDNESCTLSILSTINDTVCECTDPPGNSFATTFYVPPNTIDFTTVFKKFDLKSNAAVFGTVVSLVVVYLLLCVWAYRQDRRDHEKWAISYLADNEKYDEYLYIVTVYTGLDRNAGTKSNVFFMILDGKQSKKKRNQTDTGIRVLDDGKKQGFGVGSVRKFVMSVPRRINDPSIIKIWHDNSGQGNQASWYLNKIVLDDVQTDERFLFVCNEWLSLDYEDGTIDTAMPVADKAETSRFSFLFNEKARHNTTEGHLWLSVVIRPEDSNFTRIERLACCLCLLFLTMISNAMFYGTNTGNQIKLGPLYFSLAGIYISFISAVVAVPPIFLITYLYKNSRPRKKKTSGKQDIVKHEDTDTNEIIEVENNDNEVVDVTNRSDFSLPFWCRIVAWAIVTVAVLLSGFFLILYSMEWGKSKSEEWLLCFFLSFFESLFIVDPLKIVLLSVVLSWIFKSHKETIIKYDHDKLLQETQRRALCPSTTSSASYRGAVRPPFKSTKVSKLKEKRKRQLEMRRTFISLILYVLFLAVLYLVSFSNRDPEWFHLKNHVDQHLSTVTQSVQGDTTIRFEQVGSASNLYKWFRETLIPYLYPLNNTDGKPLSAYQRTFIKDGINYRIGPMRLRQVRTEAEPCIWNGWKNFTCYNDYSIIQEDDSDYCVAWETTPCIQWQDVYNITSDAWTHKSAVDVLGIPVIGEYTTYSGGGYIAEFIVNYKISQNIINDLFKYIWLDRKTRAVFAEFNLYNSDNNVFTVCSFLCEFLETGGALPRASINVFRPYQHVGSHGMLIIVCELLVLIGVIIFTVQKIVFLYQNGRKMLKQIWHFLDVMIIVLFFICLAMYIGRWLMVNSAMNKFEENKDKFVNFSHIVYWDELFNSFLSFVIFFTTFRLMKILSYNERISQLGRVLSHVSWELMGCFVMFLIIYIAFVMCGNLVFGRYLDTYKNLFLSSTTLVNAIIGKNSINDLFSIEPTIGRLYYFFFVLFLLWIVMTMLNATLNVGITKVRSRPLRNRYGITDIVAKFWKESIGLIAMPNSTDLKNEENKPKPENILNAGNAIYKGKDFEEIKELGNRLELDELKREATIVSSAPRSHSAKTVKKKRIYM